MLSTQESTLEILSRPIFSFLTLNPLTCFVASCVLIKSIACVAFRLASNSLAALAARSNPSGSNPVTEAPPDFFGEFSGVITFDSDSRSLLRRPPNMLRYIKSKKN